MKVWVKRRMKKRRDIFIPVIRPDLAKALAVGTIADYVGDIFAD